MQDIGTLSLMLTFSFGLCCAFWKASKGACDGHLLLQGKPTWLPGTPTPGWSRGDAVGPLLLQPPVSGAGWLDGGGRSASSAPEPFPVLQNP